MRAHTDANDTELGDPTLSGEAFGPDFLDDRAEMLFYFRQFIREGGKRNIGGAGRRDVLDDHVNIHVDRRNLIKYSRGDTRFIRYAADGDFCLSAIDAHSADDYFL